MEEERVAPPSTRRPPRMGSSSRSASAAPPLVTATAAGEGYNCGGDSEIGDDAAALAASDPAEGAKGGDDPPPPCDPPPPPVAAEKRPMSIVAPALPPTVGNEGNPPTGDEAVKGDTARRMFRAAEGAGEEATVPSPPLCGTMAAASGGGAAKANGGRPTLLRGAVLAPPLGTEINGTGVETAAVVGEEAETAEEGKRRDSSAVLYAAIACRAVHGVSPA